MKVGIWMTDAKVPPYTGPTGGTIRDGRLHIDGYPDAAHIVEFRTKKGKRLVRLRTHETALQLCELAMRGLSAMPDDNPIAKEALLIGVAVRYFSCFGVNGVIGPLSAKRVFAGKPDARECYEYWKAIRDMHFVHDESSFSSEATALVLGSSGEIQDVFSFRTATYLVDNEHPKLLYQLIRFTLEHINAEISKLLPTIFEEARAMTPEERLSLPPLKYGAPKPDDVTKRRPPFDEWSK